MSTPFFGSGFFRDFDQVRQQIDDLFRNLEVPATLRGAYRGFPPVNVGGTDDSIEVVAFAPGLDPAKLQVTVDKGLLSISGERAADARHDAEGATSHARERVWGAFRRVIELPADADPAGVEARYVDGCLRVSIKKHEASKPRVIPVQ
ncbi:Hsp20/alpha crystallin family protein [Pigmentiphaga soli]|uniref:Hsp20/alpha crystallin family protein n=1 Tax=Pigmentiphaga soli TaxID=1007095 RepID=A0ABP8GYA9_9BURK